MILLFFRWKKDRKNCVGCPCQIIWWNPICERCSQTCQWHPLVYYTTGMYLSSHLYLWAVLYIFFIGIFCILHQWYAPLTISIFMGAALSLVSCPTGVFVSTLRLGNEILLYITPLVCILNPKYMWALFLDLSIAFSCIFYTNYICEHCSQTCQWHPLVYYTTGMYLSSLVYFYFIFAVLNLISE